MMSLKAPLVTSGLVVLLFSSLFLCSCGQKKTFTSFHASSNLSSNQNRDLIIPLGFQCTEKRISNEQDGSVLITRYAGSQSCERVIAFYRREMEAAGWDLSNFSHEQEGLFFCHKGQQECAISIRSKNKTIITITYKTKYSSNARLANDIKQINKTPRSVE